MIRTNQTIALLFLGLTTLILLWGGSDAKIGARTNSRNVMMTKRRRKLQTTINVVGDAGNPPDESLPLAECWGDCDNDDECGPGLVCFQRGPNEAVPGCEGGENDGSNSDYCIADPNIPSPTATPTLPPPTQNPTKSPTENPTKQPTAAPTKVPTISPAPTPIPTSKPTQNPTKEPTPDPTVAPTVQQPFGQVEYVGNEGTFYAPFPLGVCKGDCDADEDCAEGLYCHQRVGNEPVPYCNGGEEEASTADFCAWDGISPKPEQPVPAPDPYFRLKLYWEEGYRWQNETFEREWCMMYNYDGFPGTGVCWVGDKKVNCDEDRVFVAKCVEDPRQWFTFVDVPTTSNPTEVLIRTGDGRCFQRDNREIYLDKCDASNGQQRWFALNGDLNGYRFELSQVGYTSQCLANDHHPKSGEIIETHSCEDIRGDDSQTSYWERF